MRDVDSCSYHSQFTYSSPSVWLIILKPRAMNVFSRFSAPTLVTLFCLSSGVARYVSNFLTTAGFIKREFRAPSISCPASKSIRVYTSLGRMSVMISCYSGARASYERPTIVANRSSPPMDKLWFTIKLSNFWPWFSSVCYIPMTVKRLPSLSRQGVPTAILSNWASAINVIIESISGSLSSSIRSSSAYCKVLL